MSTSQPPIGEGEFVVQRKVNPSFWSRLAKQKQGLGLMALSASCGFLALSILKQEKELTRVNEMASQLRLQNDALKERLQNVKLAVEEEGVAGQGLEMRLKDILKINASSAADQTIPLPEDPKAEMRKAIKAKFMV
ncbi:hypothetical protein MPTK1_3g22460 [Marchantia polymorpha subsp. ruderalis]|uniref:Uncharacterized protein n=2 Tax=Marchantia polymorpha TaxID=3197 RepID=A0AAF6B3L9_MARPO|nr:hypothetical protein MARPO_0024s0024 [Marchantia polymorpha]PTQ43504.1 hypothetical protein MARPO_0024s0024 [Marchantia polymorpha]BBN06603.1 hypothetical protein Mp_3g22460 [Marchantia polymorpha subsp. ruderalis]BBN06604.1 hypothetical protein Mp_3g22460 [Marchantia polymorpha subsp. ruderalis]|eukprot:PTQ43503.1 hypothetical protein MARPO_0024s0024 [Marchantia polymorpha]